MTGPTHALTGLATAVAIGRFANIPPDALSLLLLLCGSLAPDLDGNGVLTKPGTILRRLLGRVLSDLVDFVFGIFVAVVHLFFDHRGFLHSPLLAIALVLFGGVSGLNGVIWFGLGCFVHILGDSFTRAGVPIFSPFSEEMYSYSSMRTGSPKELGIAVVLLFFICYYGWVLLPENVKQAHIDLLDMLYF